MDTGFSMDTRHRASSDGQEGRPRTPLIDNKEVCNNHGILPSYHVYSTLQPDP